MQSRTHVHVLSSLMVRDYSLPFPRTHVHIYLRDQTLPDSTANVAAKLSALFHVRQREKPESIFVTRFLDLMLLYRK